MYNMENNQMKKILSIISWCLYDLSDQFFSINIISLYFARWIVIEKGYPEIFYSLAFGLSILCVALIAPVLGYASDLIKRHRIFLVLFTFLAILSTVMMGLTQKIIFALIFFSVANFASHVAVVFYNSLMVHIAPKNKIGFISGIGKMFGYLGALLALYVINPKIAPLGYQAIFLITGVSYLAFSLPCMIFVKDQVRNQDKNIIIKFEGIKKRLRDLKKSLLEIYNLPGMSSFLKSFFFAMCAVNIVILFMAVYISEVFKLSEAQITNFIALATVFAIIGSLSSGYISDHLGYQRCLRLIFILWIACFSFGAIAIQKVFYILLSTISGFSFGSIFVVARAVIIDITPKERTATAFGLFNLFGYLSNIIGPLYWGFMLLRLESLGIAKYRISLFSLNLFMLFAIFYINKLNRTCKGHKGANVQGQR